MIHRLIASLLIIDPETSHILLKIVNYVITMIIPVKNITNFSEEFVFLAEILQKCKNDDILIKILELFCEFLKGNITFQGFLTENRVFNSVLTLFMEFFKGEIGEINDKKYPKISELLQLLMKNNEENMRVFANLQCFELMIEKIAKNLDFYQDLVVFFLEEQAKIANLEPFLVILLKKYKESDVFGEKIHLSQIFITVLRKTAIKEVFRDAILKKYRFLHEFTDISKGITKDNIGIFFSNLKVFLVENGYLRKYFRKKGLFIRLFKNLTEVFKGKEEKIIRDFIDVLFDFAINKEEFIIIFPEMITFLIENIAKISGLTINLLILQQINFLLKINDRNAKILNKTSNFIETLGIVFHKELKTSIHPFYELLLEIIKNIANSAVNFSDIKVIETVILAINNEVFLYISFDFPLIFL